MGFLTEVFCSWCRSNLVAGSGWGTNRKKRKKKIVIMGVSKPVHFVFVHGGGHGAWCWYKTVDLLRLAGHKATAVDLVSCGRDSTDPNHVESFLDYNEPLMELLSNLPDNDKVLSVRRRRSSLLHLPPSPNDRSSRPNPLFFFFGFVLCVCVCALSTHKNVSGQMSVSDYFIFLRFTESCFQTYLYASAFSLKSHLSGQTLLETAILYL